MRLVHRLDSCCAVILFAELLLAVLFGNCSHALAQTVRPLKDPNNQADYLIITHPNFEQELAASFVPWRASKGYAVRVVTTTAVYKEFLDSAVQKQPQASAQAIRTFTGYVIQNWKRSVPSSSQQAVRPLYVLLVGSTDHVPTVRVRVTDPLFIDLVRYEDSVAFDEMFVVPLSARDTRPQAAIGRFPVRTVQDVKTIVAKTRLFEDGLWLRYKQDFLGLTDAEDATWFESNLRFFWTAIQFAQTKARGRVASTGTRPLRIREMNYQSDSPFKATRQDIFRAVNDGAMFWLYYGHGAPDVWSSYRIMTSKDVDTAFAAQTLPFVMASVSCRQRFDLQGIPSIVERLVNQPGGAVATFAPSGYGLLSEGGTLLELLYDTLIGDSTGRETLGSAVLKAKRNGMPSDAAEDYFARRLTVLGDPALAIPVGNLLAVHEQDITEQVQPRVVPEPASAQTVLQYTLPEPANVRVDVVNVLGQSVMDVEYGTQASGKHSELLLTDKLPSGLYVYRLFIGDKTAQGTFRVQR
jgi:hypothetical protein